MIPVSLHDPEASFLAQQCLSLPQQPRPIAFEHQLGRNRSVRIKPSISAVVGSVAEWRSGSVLGP